jgi:hypothetical protein
MRLCVTAKSDRYSAIRDSSSQLRLFRKRLLSKLLRGSYLSIALNEHFTEDAEIVFREAPRYVAG